MKIPRMTLCSSWGLTGEDMLFLTVSIFSFQRHWLTTGTGTRPFHFQTEILLLTNLAIRKGFTASWQDPDWEKSSDKDRNILKRKGSSMFRSNSIRGSKVHLSKNPKPLPHKPDKNSPKVSLCYISRSQSKCHVSQGCGNPICVILDKKPVRFSSVCQFVNFLCNNNRRQQVNFIQKGDCYDISKYPVWWDSPNLSHMSVLPAWSSLWQTHCLNHFVCWPQYSDQQFDFQCCSYSFQLLLSVWIHMNLDVAGLSNIQFDYSPIVKSF